MSFCRVLVFGASLAFSLGWLVAPEIVAKARNSVAGYVTTGPNVGGAEHPASSAPAIIPAVGVDPQPWRGIVTRH